VGCVNEPGQGCNDDNPCTKDICDADVGCLNEALPDGAACADGIQCTSNDVCTNGICAGQLDSNACNDKNDCTTDSCSEEQGCKNTPVANGTPCDDSVDATIDDACNAGKCQGFSDDCSAGITPSDPTLKVTFLEISSAQKMDIDGNGTTENAMAFVAPFLGTQLSEPVKNGQLMYLAHPDGLSKDESFPIHFFSSALAPDNPACDFQKTYCDYELSPEGFDEDCQPVASLPANTYQGNKITTTEPGTMVIPMVFDTGTANLTIHMARLDLSVSFSNGICVNFGGLLGGAVKMNELIVMMNLVPALQPLVPLINILLTPDIDTDGDGVPDAVSVVLSASGIGGKIVGVSE
jgi:hypothetical protein